MILKSWYKIDQVVSSTVPKLVHIAFKTLCFSSDIPWQSLRVDLFSHRNRNYLVIADYTSRFILK